MYLASASPPVRFPNVYGVDMPVRKEFVAYDKTEEEICAELGADALIYQSIEDLVAVGHDLNPTITEFDTSCFTGGILIFAVPPAGTDQDRKRVWRTLRRFADDLNAVTDVVVASETLSPDSIAPGVAEGPHVILLILHICAQMCGLHAKLQWLAQCLRQYHPVS